MHLFRTLKIEAVLTTLPGRYDSSKRSSCSLSGLSSGRSIVPGWRPSCQARCQVVVAAYIREPEIAALKQERQLLVVESQKGQNRRVNIIDVDRILDCFEPDLVRGADHFAAADPAARHPHRESIRVVVASASITSAV